jgi:hypothetical protein
MEVRHRLEVRRDRIVAYRQRRRMGLSLHWEDHRDQIVAYRQRRRRGLSLH